MNVVASSTPAAPESCLRGVPPTGGSTVSHPSVAGRSSPRPPATRLQSSGRPCGAGRSHGSGHRPPAPAAGPSATGGTSPAEAPGVGADEGSAAEPGPGKDAEPCEEPGAGLGDGSREEPDGGAGGGVDEEDAE